MKFRKTYICSVLMAVGLLGSCGGSGSDPDMSEVTAEPVPVRFELSSSSLSGTRAETEGEEVCERIHDWVLVFAQVNVSGKPGKIQKILTHAEAGESGVLVSEVNTVNLPPAEYFVFAFANLTVSDFSKATGLTLTEGASLPSDMLIDSSNGMVTGIYFDVEALGNSRKLNGWEGNIPMSGVRRIKASQSVSEVYSIELVRMVSKLKLQFRNAGNTPLKVKGINFATTNEGQILLFGKYDRTSSWSTDFKFKQDTEPVFVDRMKVGEYSFTKWWANDADKTGIQLSESSIDLSTPKAQSDKYDSSLPYVSTYLAESTPQHPTGRYLLTFDIEKEGVDLSETGGKLTALMPIDLTHFNRNDYVIVPVAFSDWDVDFEVRFYPPIGGYPALVTNTKEEFFATFGTAGYFEIISKVRKSGESEWEPAEKVKVKVETLKVYDKDGKEMKEGNGPDKDYLFQKEIDFDNIGATKPSATDEIVGDIRTGVFGSVVLRFSFEVDGKPGPFPSKQIHIIRK